MSRAVKQARRGRKAIATKRSAKGIPSGVTKRSGTEKVDPVGGPKGPSYPGPLIIRQD